MNAYIGINNVAKTIRDVYIGDSNGVARSVSKIFKGINNVAQDIMQKDSKIGNLEELEKYFVVTEPSDERFSFKIYPKTDVEEVVLYAQYIINGNIYTYKDFEQSHNHQNNYFTTNKLILKSDYLDDFSRIDMTLARLLKWADYFFDSDITDKTAVFDCDITSESNLFFVGSKYFMRIDISNFDFSHVDGIMIDFFASLVKHIYVNETWDVEKVSEEQINFNPYIFNECYNLPNFDRQAEDQAMYTHAYVGSPSGYFEYKS